VAVAVAAFPEEAVLLSLLIFVATSSEAIAIVVIAVASPMILNRVQAATLVAVKGAVKGAGRAARSVATSNEVTVTAGTSAALAMALEMEVEAEESVLEIGPAPIAAQWSSHPKANASSATLRETARRELELVVKVVLLQKSMPRASGSSQELRLD